MPDSPDPNQTVYYPYVPSTVSPQGSPSPASPAPTVRPDPSAETLSSPPLIADASSPKPEPESITETPPKKKSHLWLVIGVIMMVLALALAVVVVLPIVMDKSDEPGYAKTPSEAVKEFLTALADGDAETALLYSAHSVEDTTFLSNEFYAGIVQANPITDITVPNVAVSTHPTVAVNATYALDQQLINAVFTTRRDKGYWFLDQVTQEVALPSEYLMPLFLSGVDISDKTTVTLLPGVYEVSVSSPMFAINNGYLVIEDPYGDVPLDAFKLTLKEQAIADIRSAAQAKLASCMAQKSIAPDGCGFVVTNESGLDIDPDSIRWTLIDNDGSFADLIPVLGDSAPQVATATVSITLSVTVDFMDGHQASARTAIRKVTANFSDPTAMTILFSE